MQRHGHAGRARDRAQPLRQAQVVPRAQLRVHVRGHDSERGRRDGAAAQPALGHLQRGQRRDRGDPRPGVVGEQPVLSPGEAFTYSSYCQLAAPRGSMEGSYEFVELRQGRPVRTFNVAIGRFALQADGEA